MDLLLSFLFSGGLISVIIIIAVIALFFNFVPLGLWISAIAAGVNVGIFNLIGMRLRRVPASQIVLPLIKANKAGMDVNVNQLEAHYLAGGNVDRVIDALIAAHRAQIPLTFERSCAIDLAGRNVLEAVQMSVNPEVIETPVVSAVAKNGIELKVKARVTVRANIDRLVGGAGEATIIARVGEGIVTNVGSASSHTDVLENPDYISRTVLAKGLDAGTAFEILSIDIADVDVGRRCRTQHRRSFADRPGGSRQTHCTGPCGRTPRYGRCQRTGNESLHAGNAGQSCGSRGQSACRTGGCTAKRPPWRDGLLPHEQHQCRYRYAQNDCRYGTGHGS